MRATPGGAGAATTGAATGGCSGSWVVAGDSDTPGGMARQRALTGNLAVAAAARDRALRAGERTERRAMVEAMASRLLCHALGGGLGPVTRTRAVLEATGSTARSRCSPRRGRRRWPAASSSAHPATTTPPTRRRSRAGSRARSPTSRPDAVLVDALPGGVLGELCGLAALDGLELRHTARLLRWAGYARRIDGAAAALRRGPRGRAAARGPRARARGARRRRGAADAPGPAAGPAAARARRALARGPHRPGARGPRARADRGRAPRRRAAARRRADRGRRAPAARRAGRRDPRRAALRRRRRDRHRRRLQHRPRARAVPRAPRLRPVRPPVRRPARTRAGGTPAHESRQQLRLEHRRRTRPGGRRSAAT